MLTVITGPMFAGKSSKLISMCTANVIAGNFVLGFKPNNDTRYIKDKICTHVNSTFPAIPISVENPFEALTAIEKYRERGHSVDVVVFDEAQFFNKEPFESLVSSILNEDISVIVAGLSQDSFGNPFGAMPFLLSVCDEIVSLKAVCGKCKKINSATRTFRKIKSKEQVAVGGIDDYEPRCFECWNEFLK